MSGRLVQLAWRNLWRNPRRTFIAMAAIALGYAMLLFVACLMAGLRWQMIENGTRLVLSEIQVHASGYYPSRSIQKTIGGRKGTDVSALLAAITADPRVYAAAPRVYGYGLASASHGSSAGVALMGVVPDQEPKVTVLNTQIVKGDYLTKLRPHGVVVGDKLAGVIGVEVGSEMVLLAQAADGSMGNDLYTVGGIFHTGLDVLDRNLVLMPLSSLQELLQLTPDRIHEVGIKLHNITEATTVATALQARLSKTLPVEVSAWPTLAPDLADYVQFNHGVTLVLFLIFFLLAVIGIMNTMLMAVFERTRELGMLMALGMRPVQVIGLIMAEAAGLAVASLVLGAAIGAPLLWYLQEHGLDLGGATGEVVSVAGVVVGHLWYGRQDFSAYAQAAVGLAVTALVSALYPAWRAAHFRPTEAIRKV
ncbi:MAG TPA: FtsX-like permease family protein [Candidatus Binataceae bacterium]|nr:FtsX-like permease family protein [Candidatus Binataceae bacterium]